MILNLAADSIVLVVVVERAHPCRAVRFGGGGGGGWRTAALPYVLLPAIASATFRSRFGDLDSLNSQASGCYARH